MPSGTGRKSRLLACSISESRSCASPSSRRAASSVTHAFDRGARLVARRQLVLRPAPRRLHDLPRITGRRRRMNDDDAGRALPRRALVLVDPAAVVEPRRALEQRRIPVGIVVEHDEHLAAHVDVLEVVPAVLRAPGSRSPRTRAPRRATSAVGACTPLLATKSVPRASSTASPPRVKRHVAGASRRDADELDRLLVAAAVAAGREAEPRELGREIRAREHVAFGSRQAAAVTVVRELGDDAADLLAVDGLRGCPGRCRDQRVRGRGGAADEAPSGAVSPSRLQAATQPTTTSASAARPHATLLNRPHASSTIRRRAPVCPRLRSRP